MDYTKRPFTLQEQVDKLRDRGLLIDDEQLAKEYLSNISYYRLRAYTYPFQYNINPSADHRFLRSDIHFSDIIDLYRFDRRLRSVIFNAIEKTLSHFALARQKETSGTEFFITTLIISIVGLGGVEKQPLKLVG